MDSEARHLRLGHVPDLAESRLQPGREERIPVAFRIPPFDDAESLVGLPNGVCEQAGRRSLLVVPAQLDADGVILVGADPLKLQDLANRHNCLL